MTINLKMISEKMIQGFFYLCLSWVVIALCTQCIFLYFQVTGQNERLSEISTKVTHRIDGAFKNDPDNIWYEAADKK